jgi:hypothetical protein
MSTGSMAGVGEGMESKTNITKKEKTRILFLEDLDLTITSTSVLRRVVFIFSTPWLQKKTNGKTFAFDPG